MASPMTISTRLAAALLGVLAPALLACSPAEKVVHEDNPTGVLVHSVLRHSLAVQGSEASDLRLKVLGFAPDSEAGEGLVRIAQKLERELPIQPPLSTKEERRARLNQRLYVTGRELGYWLQDIQKDGEDPEAVLNRMLYDSSWRMNTSSSGDSLLSRLGLSKSDPESLVEMLADLDSHFRRGLKEAMGEVPTYVTQGQE